MRYLGNITPTRSLLQPFRHQPVCCDPGSTRPRPNNLPAGHVLRPNVRLTKKGNFTLLSARFSEMVRLLNYIISRYTKLVGSWGRLLVHSFTIILSYLITARQLFNNHLFIISVSDQSRRSVEAKLLSETCYYHISTDIRFSGSVEKRKYNSHIRFDYYLYSHYSYS